MNPVAIVLGAGALGLGAFAAARARAKAPPLPAPAPPEPKRLPDPDRKPGGDVVPIDVQKAQTLLVRLGARIAQDGKLGPKTKDAWAKAAKARKLDASMNGPAGGAQAYVHPRTAKALAEAAAAAPPIPAPKPKPPAPKPPAPDLEADERAARKAAEEAKRREDEARAQAAAEQKKEQKQKQQPRHELVNNAINALDRATPKDNAGVRKSVTDLVNHWHDDFWDKGKRDEPAKLDSYAAWYTRAWNLVPAAVQAKVPHPRTIDPKWQDAPAPAPTTTTTVQPVKNVQNIVKALGAKIAVDGKLGPDTKKAWEAAASNRQLNGLITANGPVNVTVYRTTYDRLAADAKAKAAAPTPTPPAPAPAPKPAGIADKPIDTSKAQTLLVRLGASIAIDGKFGPKTSAAWQDAARARNLSPVVTGTTNAATFKVDARTAAELAAAAAAAPPVPAPKPATPAPAPKPSAEAAVIDVLRAQRILNAHGAGLAADGLYGPRSRTAWEKLATASHVSVRFEKASNDGRTVRVDAQTLRTLEALPPSAAAKAPVGYDRTKAKQRAKEITAHLRKAGKAYDKKTLAGWQTQAGIPADGLYGPHTKNALVYYGATDAPAPFVAGTDRPYTPPA